MIVEEHFLPVETRLSASKFCVSGSWSDTPPITFEHGGSVTNIAVKVDGKRPIGGRARCIREPHLLLVTYSGGRSSGTSTKTVCETLDDLKDFCQPHAPGRNRDSPNATSRITSFIACMNVCVCVCVFSRSPTEGGVCVQRPGVSLLSAASERAADAAVGRRGGAPQLVTAAHRIWAG